MIARAAGGFILAMAGIQFLLGPFDRGRDLLVAVVVAAGFGALAAWWTREEKRTLEPGMFDARATRRAVRRGVVRTALVSIVWVLVALILFSGISAMWQTRGDRGTHLRDVVQYGFFVARAGFVPTSRNGGFCCNTGLRSLEMQLQAEPRTAERLAQPVYLTLHVDLRGRLEGLPLLPRTVVDVLADEDTPALERLPDGLVATAVVELRSPLEVEDVYGLLARHGIEAGSGAGAYLQSRDASYRFHQRVSWPDLNLAQFQAWVKLLRGSDNGLLSDLGAPPVSTLRAIAQRPRVYGLVLDDVSSEQLRGLVAEHAVASVGIGDVAFDLTGLSS